MVKIKPMSETQAKDQLDTLFQVWREGLNVPLPMPLKTSLALAKQIRTKEPQKLEVIYEGGGDDFSDEVAEVTDICLARLFPEFEDLLQGEPLEKSRWYTLADMLYVPMLAWSDEFVTTHPYQ